MSCWRLSRGLPCCEVEQVLVIPDVRQAEEYDCGTACVDAVLRFYGVRTTAHVLQLANPQQGTSPETVAALFRRAGRPVASGNMTADDLRHYTRRGVPVVCPVSLHGGHWVVVRGATAGARGRVHFHCPSDGPLSLPRADWEDIWHDTSGEGVDWKQWGIAVG